MAVARAVAFRLRMTAASSDGKLLTGKRRIQSTAAASYKGQVFREDDYREWLARYPGGAVRLHQCDETGVALLRLAHAQKMNALTGTMMVELSNVVSHLEYWEKGRAVVMRGEEGTFCAGGDLDFMLAIGDSKSGERMSRFMHEVMGRFRRLPLITVAAVEGNALGGGAELAVHCDLRLIHRDAKIGFRQSQLGISPGWACTTPLVGLVGRGRAIDLLAGGRVLSAEEAVKIRLADEIFDDESEIDAFVSRYTTGELGAVRAAKSLVADLAAGDELATKYALERRTFSRLWGGAGHKRRLASLMQQLKRR